MTRDPLLFTESQLYETIYSISHASKKKLKKRGEGGGRRGVIPSLTSLTFTPSLIPLFL